MAALLALLVSVPAAGDDVPGTHIETITEASHEYTITMGGTMDGVNTRDPVGYGAYDQRFEPNVSVRLENLGRDIVAGPRLIANDRRRWRDIDEVIAEALRDLPPDAPDRDRARAIWEFQRRHRFHATTGDLEVVDPVKMLNIYGYTLCGDDAQVVADLWRAAGLRTRRGRPMGHCTTEVFYDDGWHLLDGDENIICLLRDNETIAQEADIVRDHDLMKRTHTYGILHGDSRDTDEFSASLTVYDGDDRSGEWDSHVGHAMGFVLRPGESIEWRWDHREKAHGKWEGKSLLTGWGKTAWARHANGYWRYEPRLTSRFLTSFVSATGLATYVTRSPRLHPAKPGDPGDVLVPVVTPYVIVGGRVRLTGARVTAGRISVRLSFDGENWKPLGDVQAGDALVDLDPLFPPDGPARYAYFLALEMRADGRVDDVGIDGLLIENDLQMAPLSLPALQVGENRFSYTDHSSGPRKVRVTHSWIERSDSRPPTSPAAPIYPADAGEAEGTGIRFEWQPAADADGDAIADHHFQLSDQADMRWVLSPNFDKLIARTADKGTASYTLPYDGLLNPDQTYYWRVRARGAQGVWGPWSDTWSFTPRGPGLPVEVRLERGVLRWRPGPQGRKPVAYRVYGSDEKGFTVSDTEYTVNAGNQPDKLDPAFPANFVAEVADEQLQVIGPGVGLPNANRAFYRVVAVDAHGNRSGPSDYVSAPRPLIVTDPPTAAGVGEPLEHALATIRSLGDLRCRLIDGNPYNANFWDVEHPEWRLTRGPDWLSIDASTGLLSGTPEQAGAVDVTVEVETPGVGADSRSWKLTVH